MIFVSAAIPAAAIVSVVANTRKKLPQIDSVQFRIIFAQQYLLEPSKKEKKKN